jgi:phage-related tail fiber protein
MPVSISNNGAPCGSHLMHNGTSPPAGYFVENGAAVSRTTYAALFAVIGTTHGVGDGATTFNLPESRGEFPRYLDSGRGVDTGRALGVWQGSQNLAHGHGVSDGGHAHGLPGINRTLAVDVGGGANYAAAAGASTRDLTAVNASGTGISIIADGGGEARPRNVPKLPCIKWAP